MRKNTRQFNTLDLAVHGMVNAEVDAVMGLRSQITSLHHQLQSSASPKSSQYQLANNAFPLLGKQKWDIGMAVKKLDSIIVDGKVFANFQSNKKRVRKFDD